MKAWPGLALAVGARGGGRGCGGLFLSDTGNGVWGGVGWGGKREVVFWLVPCMTWESSTVTRMPSLEICICALDMNPIHFSSMNICRAEVVNASNTGGGPSSSWPWSSIVFSLVWGGELVVEEDDSQVGKKGRKKSIYVKITACSSTKSYDTGAYTLWRIRTPAMI